MVHYVLFRHKIVFSLVGLIPPLRVVLRYRAGVYLPIRYVRKEGLVVAPERAPFFGVHFGDLTGRLSVLVYLLIHRFIAFTFQLMYHL